MQVGFLLSTTGMKFHLDTFVTLLLRISVVSFSFELPFVYFKLTNLEAENGGSVLLELECITNGGRGLAVLSDSGQYVGLHGQ
jgi:hypothetical protein